MTNSTTPRKHMSAFPMVRRSAGFRRILESVMHAGREFLARDRRGADRAGEPAQALGELCRQLLDHRGEASGLALANEILSRYQALSTQGRLAFFHLLTEQFGPDPQAITAAAEAYRSEPGFETLAALARAMEAPRQRLFGRLNMVPDGTGALVSLRGELLELTRVHPALRAVEADLRHLLAAWFNRGFLVMDRIDWTSSANVLEKIIAYEAVHEINGWEDLRARLAEDRRCFAFFHPTMPDDPLIFVQVALTTELPGAIGPLIAADRSPVNVRDADTAVFYSISNCHAGLRGISFGHFLIKQVIEELRRDLDGIKRFVTLSPVPGFRGWLAGTAIEALPERLQADARAARELLSVAAPFDVAQATEQTRDGLMRLCAHYLLNVREDSGEPVDPVARFHLGNGAALERIHWAADASAVGVGRSAGIMVNYVYRLREIERNHELYFSDGKIVASAIVRKLAQSR